MNKKKKGFTLAELLVVVAILSALVAIALPLFLKQKYEANLKADQTYVKSAKAEAVAEYLAGDEDEDTGSGIDYVFDGGLSMAFRTNSEASNDIKGYGRSTKDPYNTQTGVTDNSLPVQDGTSNFLKVHVKDGKATNVCWVNDKTTSCGDSGNTDQPDITPTSSPTPTTTPSDPNYECACKKPEAISKFQEKLRNAAIEDYRIPSPDAPLVTQMGQIYSYNNKLYVCVSPNTYTFSGAVPGAEVTNYQFIEVTSSSKILLECDATFRYNEWDHEAKFESLEEGDIYWDGNEYYLSRGHYEHYPIPTESTLLDRWVIIKMK